jgi:hypothetical protein
MCDISIYQKDDSNQQSQIAIKPTGNANENPQNSRKTKIRNPRPHQNKTKPQTKP